MKHKALQLYEKDVLHHGTGREVIGLIGTHHGVGVTYTGLMLAFYMGEEKGKTTAYLECNNHQDMRLLQNSYEWSREERDFFSYHRVTCYPKVNRNQIADIFCEDYDCVIMDFGTDYNNNKEEFLRCSTKIVVSGRSVWDVQKLNDFVEKIQSQLGSDDWFYFIPMASNKLIQNVKSKINRKVFSVPNIEVPVIPSKQINQFFGRIF
jgi:hypothetical protein